MCDWSGFDSFGTVPAECVIGLGSIPCWMCDWFGFDPCGCSARWMCDWCGFDPCDGSACWMCDWYGFDPCCTVPAGCVIGVDFIPVVHCLLDV